MNSFSVSSRKTINLLAAATMLIGTCLTSIGSASFLSKAEAAVNPEPAAAITSVTALAEEFESISLLSPSSAKANSVKIESTSRPAPVRYGYHAAKLSYDFIGQTGTSAAYINFKDANGATGKPLEGAPKKIGMWVYGDGNNHWLRAQLQDATGSKPAIDFTTSTGLNWNGWKYVTAPVPTTAQPPLKINQIYVVETKDSNKNAGTLYFDQVSTIYSDTTTFGLDFLGLTPMQVGQTKQARLAATYLNSTEPVTVTTGAQFTSSNPEVATIDAAGVVQALQPGSTTLTATLPNAPTGTFTLQVTSGASAPERIELATNTEQTIGDPNRIRVYAAYTGYKDPIEILDGATFQSSSPDNATVDAAGNITALKAGNTTITASFSGVTNSFPLTVKNPIPVLQKIEIIGVSPVTIGQSRTAKAMATYSYMTEQVDVTNSVTWKSAATDIATINAQGVMTGLKSGTSKITATLNGKVAEALLIVNNPASVPKRELRAAWIASVDNIDWPKKGVVNVEQQKQDFIKLLDELKAAGMNAVIVQIKPTADSFYPSQYGPWSEWLTGVQGKDPGYNPLAFMIEEVHKRNLEFHGWFNPYRISLQDDVSKLVADHPAKLHPDWMVTYGGKLYFNPGIPAAKDFIIDGVMEVVKQYDIDGVHFDDYFYPYPVSGVDFPDQASFQTYGSGFTNKADWRRNNVNTFIQQLGAEIKHEKPYVQFGISPFGIWRNKTQDATGSDTNGLSNYDDLYADTRTWIKQGWIDYITPQIYWHFGYSPAAYEKLVEWWSKEVEGSNVNLFIGQSPYRIGTDPAWMQPDEQPNQLIYNRNFPAIDGSMFFSAKSVVSNPLGFADTLKSSIYRYPALIPTMPWLDDQAPAQPTLVNAIRKADGVHLSWKDQLQNDSSYYAIYKFKESQTANTNDATSLIGTVRRVNGELQTFTDSFPSDGQTYSYVVTSLDRLHNESTTSNLVTVTNTPDLEAPMTQAAIKGTQSGAWYTSDVQISLSASDNQSGVSKIEYSLNGGQQWLTYESPITLQADGTHTVQYRSTDAADNVENVKSVLISIDHTPPSIQFTGGGTYTVDQSVVISCTAADTVSGIVYNPCAAPLVNSPAYLLGLGSHVVTVNVTDGSGHETSAFVEYTVSVTTESLISLVEQWVTGPGSNGIINSLTKKLEENNIEPFIHEVKAQKGNKIPADKADHLIQLAEQL